MLSLSSMCCYLQDSLKFVKVALVRPQHEAQRGKTESNSCVSPCSIHIPLHHDPHSSLSRVIPSSRDRVLKVRAWFPTHIILAVSSHDPATLFHPVNGDKNLTAGSGPLLRSHESSSILGKPRIWGRFGNRRFRIRVTCRVVPPSQRTRRASSPRKNFRAGIHKGRCCAYAVT